MTKSKNFPTLRESLSPISRNLELYPFNWVQKNLFWGNGTLFWTQMVPWTFNSTVLKNFWWSIFIGVINFDPENQNEKFKKAQQPHLFLKRLGLFWSASCDHLNQHTGIPGLWTQVLDATLEKLETGHWTLLLTGSEQNQNPVSDSAWLSHWKFIGYSYLYE